MIRHFIYIKTKLKNKDKLLVKLYKNNISVYDIYEKGTYLYLKVNYSDKEVLKEKIVTTKFYYVNDSGIHHIKNIISPLKILSIFLFVFFINFLSQIIIKVEVIHSNKEIRELVESSLEDYGVKKGTLKKDYQELEEIKNKIINAYKDKIEWLEIENIGMKYIVRIEERIINNIKNDNKYCHIIAKKSGIISNATSTSGEILAINGQYVKEGDILISGQIKFNEEVKNNVCAKGRVLAEVWYTTRVSLPVNYSDTKRTGKMRYNLLVETNKKKYKIFNSRLENYESEQKKLFSLFNIIFYKIEEHEIEVNKKKYELETGSEKALELADNKIKIKLNDNEYIKSRKVLKKSINNSTIDIEIFYVIIENIAKTEEYSIIEEEGS